MGGHNSVYFHGNGPKAFEGIPIVTSFVPKRGISSTGELWVRLHIHDFYGSKKTTPLFCTPTSRLLPSRRDFKFDIIYYSIKTFL